MASTGSEEILDGNIISTPKQRKASPEGTRYPSPLGATPRPPLPQKYGLASSYDGRDEYKVSGWQEIRAKENAWLRTRVQDHQQSKPSSDSRYSQWLYTNNKESSRYTNIRSYNNGNSIHSWIYLVLIFIVAVVLIGALYLYLPNLKEEEKQFIKVPRDIEDAKNLGKVLSSYKELYYYQVLLGYFMTYIFLQSFAIPGSIFLSILSGFLFPFPLALSLVCLCSAVGASFCYLLSYLVGRALVNKYIPERVIEWSSHVEKHRQHLLNYIIFLRITPFLPNWFINIASPVINVPLLPFFMGTFLGVAPPSFVAIQAGTTLHQLSSSGDAVSWTSMAVLGLFAALSLLPVFFKRTLQKKYD